VRKRNWQKYNTSLVQRGSLSFFIDQKLLKNTKKMTLGRPKIFSDAVISSLFMIKIFFRLPYRALQGFAKFMGPLLKFLDQVPVMNLSANPFSQSFYSALNAKSPLFAPSFFVRDCFCSH
jgi:hypothetical protein